MLSLPLAMGICDERDGHPRTRGRRWRTPRGASASRVASCRSARRATGPRGPLPRPRPLPRPGSPLLFSDDEVLSLQYPPAVSEAREMRDAVNRWHAKLAEGVPRRARARGRVRVQGRGLGRAQPDVRRRERRQRRGVLPRVASLAGRTQPRRRRVPRGGVPRVEPSSRVRRVARSEVAALFQRGHDRLVRPQRRRDDRLRGDSGSGGPRGGGGDELRRALQRPLFDVLRLLPSSESARRRGALLGRGPRAELAHGLPPRAVGPRERGGGERPRGGGSRRGSRGGAFALGVQGRVAGGGGAAAQGAPGGRCGARLVSLFAAAYAGTDEGVEAGKQVMEQDLESAHADVARRCAELLRQMPTTLKEDARAPRAKEEEETETEGARAARAYRAHKKEVLVDAILELGRGKWSFRRGTGMREARGEGEERGERDERGRDDRHRFGGNVFRSAAT